MIIEARKLEIIDIARWKVLEEGVLGAIQNRYSKSVDVVMDVVHCHAEVGWVSMARDSTKMTVLNVRNGLH